MNMYRDCIRPNNQLSEQVDQTDPAFTYWSPTSPLPEDMIGWLVSLHLPANRNKDVPAVSCVVIVDKKYSLEEADQEGRNQLFDKIPISYIDEIGLNGVVVGELYQLDHPGTPVPLSCSNCGKLDCAYVTEPGRLWCPNRSPSIYTDAEWAAELTRWTGITKCVSCEPLCLNQVRLV